jgi:tRNA 2-thiouridine synthesizing protein A
MEHHSKSCFSASFSLDCSAQLCPVPILMTEEKITDLKPGEVLEVIFTDPGAEPDLKAWCVTTGHEFLGIQKEKFKGMAYIKK